jgi:hypothetical protein
MSDAKDYYYYQLTSLTTGEPSLYYRLATNFTNPEVWSGVAKSWVPSESLMDKLMSGDPAVDELDSDPTKNL